MTNSAVRSSSLVLAFFLASALAIGCSGESTVVVVSVDADKAVPPVSQLRATFGNAGTTDVAVFPRSAGPSDMDFPTAFSVTLPSALGGDLAVVLEAIDDAGKVVGWTSMTGHVEIAGGRIDIALILVPCPKDGCPVMGGDGGVDGVGDGGMVDGSGGGDGGVGDVSDSGTDRGEAGMGGAGGGVGADASDGTGGTGGGGGVGGMGGTGGGVPDAGPDAPPPPKACYDPVTSSGCAAGQKCSILCGTPPGPGLWCIPAGTILPGAACTPSTKSDPCVAGAYCTTNSAVYKCTKYCSSDADCGGQKCVDTGCGSVKAKGCSF